MKIIRCDQCKVDIDNDKIFIGTFRRAEFVGDSICEKSPVLGFGAHFCSGQCFIDFLHDFFNRGVGK